MTYTERLIREARSHADISQLQAGARSLILEMANALEYYVEKHKEDRQ